jgi:hypothetical protein
VDGVEGVEELLLRALLVRDELDVIDEQQRQSTAYSGSSSSW